MITPEVGKIKENRITKFIICTEDCSGLGFAKMLLDGNTSRGKPREERAQTEVILAVSPKDNEDDLERLDMVGQGMVPKEDFDYIFGKRKEYREWAWIFDMNILSSQAEQLRTEGFYVFGGHGLTDKMEHDRAFGVQLVDKAGLDSPPTKEFKNKAEATTFMDENSEKAYIFKPDEPDDEKGWVTTVPGNDNDVKANREIYDYLESVEGDGEFILQERQKGVELNIEMWLYKGEPFFSHANFECKRKDDKDLGKMIGCAQDIEFLIPLRCKVLNETIWKLIKLPEFEDFTGMVDMNVIVADNRYWFLEFCGRFGYNSHPNLFLTLALSPLQEILSDFILGNVEDFSRHFRAGFGASITVWVDNQISGIPITFDDEQDVASRFYHFDTYTDDGENYKLAGYAHEVGIMCAHDYDLKSASDEVMNKIDHVHYSGITHRTDLNKEDYLSNPQERYVACMAMKLFE